jgi:colicin import membrane protein
MKVRLVGLALLGGVSCGAVAETEHDRIVAERTAVNAAFAERERECATRFIVAPCVDEARTDQRAALSKLRQRELQLDETTRRAAAESRRKAIAEKAEKAEKAEAQPARPSDESPEVAGERFRRSPEPTEPTPARPWNDALPGRSGARSPATARAAIERRNEAQFAAHRREAEAHRDEVARRNAERAAKGKTAAPLPVPPSSPR